MMQIKVIYAVDGTTHTDLFICRESSVTMLSDGGRTIISFTDGTDTQGNTVISVGYAKAYKVIRTELETPIPVGTSGFWGHPPLRSVA